MIKIFVIVVTYKGRQWYDRCFQSLRESTIPIQILVVDNTPGDKDAVYIMTHYPEIHLIKSNDNLGFGRANNIGMRYALDHGCDYVFLLNQDAWLEKPSSLEQLLSIVEEYPGYAIYSPMHMTADMQHLNFIIDDGKLNYELLSDLYTNNIKDIYPLTYVNAAAWLLPRRTLETIGGFCPLIYHYGEDDDYINRVHYHKGGIALVPLSRIIHDHKSRLDNSQALFEKSNKDDLDIYLNLSDNRTPTKWQWYYFKKWVRAIFQRDKATFLLTKYKLSFLWKMKGKIIKCREQHKIMQPNWL